MRLDRRYLDEKRRSVRPIGRWRHQREQNAPSQSRYGLRADKRARWRRVDGALEWGLSDRRPKVDRRASQGRRLRGLAKHAGSEEAKPQTRDVPNAPKKAVAKRGRAEKSLGQQGPLHDHKIPFRRFGPCEGFVLRRWGGAVQQARGEAVDRAKRPLMEAGRIVLLRGGGCVFLREIAGDKAQKQVYCSVRKQMRCTAQKQARFWDRVIQRCPNHRDLWRQERSRSLIDLWEQKRYRKWRLRWRWSALRWECLLCEMSVTSKEWMCRERPFVWRPRRDRFVREHGLLGVVCFYFV